MIAWLIFVLMLVVVVAAYFAGVSVGRGEDVRYHDVESCPFAQDAQRQRELATFWQSRLHIYFREVQHTQRAIRRLKRRLARQKPKGVPCT